MTIQLKRCECDARDPFAAQYHGGKTDGCPRDAYDYGPGMVTSPALCLACLHGCTDLDENGHDLDKRDL